MKFSIRDLLWLTFVVALLLCNWLQFSASVSKLDAVKLQLEEKNRESQIWEARASELQNRADMLIERYSAESNSRPFVPNSRKREP